MKEKTQTIGSFLRDHLWQIIVIIFVSSISFTILKEEVKSLAKRVEAVETHQAEYPSQQWFELKFSIIDEKIDNLEKKIDNHASLTE